MFWSAVALAPVVAFAVYVASAASIDRAYRSAQSLPPAVGAVLGYALLGLAGPAVAGLVAAGCLRAARGVSSAGTALLAELAGTAVALAAGFWMLHAGVT